MTEQKQNKSTSLQKVEKKEKGEKPSVKKEEGEGTRFDVLKKKVISKSDAKITYILDKMLVEGASPQDMFERVAPIVKEKGLKSYNSIGAMKGFIHAREKEGWKFTVEGEKRTLVGLV